jgi:hypothetical protein
MIFRQNKVEMKGTTIVISKIGPKKNLFEVVGEKTLNPKHG